MAILKVSSNVRNDKVSVSFSIKGEDKEVIEATKILTSSFEKISHSSSTNSSDENELDRTQDAFMKGMHDCIVEYFKNKKK